MTNLAGVSLRSRAELALAVPMVQALGVRLLDEDDPAAGVGLDVEGLATNGAGGVHASALGFVLELSAYLALLPHLAIEEHAVTHSSAMQLFASAAEGATLTIVASVDRRTTRLGFVSATARTPERLIARAQLTKSVVSARR